MHISTIVYNIIQMSHKDILILIFKNKNSEFKIQFSVLLKWLKTKKKSKTYRTRNGFLNNENMYTFQTYYTNGIQQIIILRHSDIFNNNVPFFYSKRQITVKFMQTNRTEMNYSYRILLKPFT